MYSAFGIKAQDTAWVCLPDSFESFTLDHLNTPSIEFSPVYYGPGLVFVMAREKQRFLDPTTGQAYFDLMYADLGIDGRGSKPINFSPNIRTQYHEGSCAFSADQKEIYFTRSNVSAGKGVEDQKGEVQLKIFTADKGAEDWENIRPLNISSDDYSIAHPTISPDGQYLVFSSNMPGSLGGMDLYISRRMGSEWGTPTNLEHLNTKGNEIFPVWHTAGFLSFSSDGRKGPGGLDLFITPFDNTITPASIQLLPEPFNSSKDDLGLIINADGTQGYWASSRKPSKGKDDIWGWRSEVSIFCNYSPLPSVFDAKEIMVVNENQESLDQAYVWLIPLTGERKAFFEEHFDTRIVPSETEPGKFLFKWTTTDSLTYSSADGITGIDGKSILYPNPIQTYALAVQRSKYQPVIEMVRGDEIPSVISMKAVPEANVPCYQTIFSITDESGNKKLNGSAITLEAPCLPNTIRVYADHDGLVRLCLPKGCRVDASIEQVGYAKHTFAFSPEEDFEEWKVFLKSDDGITSPVAPISTGTVIVLDNIYYDFNKSAIRKGDAAELISIANILKQYPDLRIEMTSHTDTRGGAEYNLELSQKRADAAKEYLITLGIRGDRIITKAAGETSPRNKCVDGVECSEEEHQYNRRTEVTIINPAQGMEIRYKSN